MVEINSKLLGKTIAELLDGEIRFYLPDDLVNLVDRL